MFCERACPQPARPVLHLQRIGNDTLGISPALLLILAPVQWSKAAQALHHIGWKFWAFLPFHW
jgi:hypothetical protein